MKNITVFVLAENSWGEPELLAYDLSVSQEQYDNGEHYDMADAKAKESGYAVKGTFDQFDMAGKQLLGKSQLYGDGPRFASEIGQSRDVFIAAPARS